MGIGNQFVSALLQSPLHRILSGSTDLIRYTGRTSGRTFSTPTQYARHGDDFLILVGRPATKTWWKNFRTEHELDLLIQGQWLPMSAHAVSGKEDMEETARLTNVYFERFPRAAKALGTGSSAERTRQTVIVRCSAR